MEILKYSTIGQSYQHYSFWTGRAFRRSSSDKDQPLPPSPWQHGIRGTDRSEGHVECEGALLTWPSDPA